MLYYQVMVVMNTYLEDIIDIFIFNYYGIFFQSSKNLRNPIFKLLKMNSEKNWDFINTYLLKYIYF